MIEFVHNALSATVKVYSVTFWAYVAYMVATK